VVYSGEPRVPFPIFNEKVLAGLGAKLSETGAIAKSAADKALRALRRFKLLVDHIDTQRTHLLATAAVREASNGPDFVRRVKALGLPCRVLSPEEEANLAGLGVLSAIPWATGVVGDLGGGSLELVAVGDGRTSSPISLPLGVLRAGRDIKAMRKAIRKAVSDGGLPRGGNFYVVGGSWRALARIDMLATDYPLPILQQYQLLPERVAELLKLVVDQQSEWTEIIASARLASSPVAAMILAAIVDELKPSRIVVSTYGIREGLLYSGLSSRQRRLDPLVSAAQALSKAEGPTESHGDSLDSWMSRAFDDPPELARLRTAACLLADVAWRANPIFRAERAIEQALHGNWVGIDAAGRVLMAQALSYAFDNDDLADTKLLQLCRDRDVHRAKAWGLAIRTGQRLSGGVASMLRETQLQATRDKLELRIPACEADVVNDAVLKRLARLADALELRPAVEPIR
jgi:exopolyphosphatase/guanosine-5'-triphosphate,3'-diphosphate pyrophosphatase